MTTTTDGGRWPREERLNRSAMLLGHYEALFLLIAVGAGIASDVLGNPAALSWPVTATWLAWFVTIAADLRCHRWQLCERCIRHAPALNPQAAVDRWRRALWLFHQRLVQAALMAVMLGLIFTSALGHHEQPWQYAIDVLALVILAGVTVARYEHGRLQPWCPWCHWGDGGDEEAAPVAPEDHGVKV